MKSHSLCSHHEVEGSPPNGWGGRSGSAEGKLGREEGEDGEGRRTGWADGARLRGGQLKAEWGRAWKGGREGGKGACGR